MRRCQAGWDPALESDQLEPPAPCDHGGRTRRMTRVTARSTTPVSRISTGTPTVPGKANVVTDGLPGRQIVG
jgi:hypothetical protein